MDHAKVIDTADQIHACLQRLQPMSGIPTAPGQGGQTLAERGIQSFNKRGIEHTSSVRLCQEFLGPVECSLGHASSDLDDPLVPSVFDDGGDQKLRPRLQGGSSSANGALDLFAKRAPNTAGIGSPAIGANQKWSQRLAARSDLPQQPISQASISAEAESSCKPQAGRNHHGQAHPGDHLSPFNGMITNDKFCMSRFVRLRLGQWQLPLSLRAQAAQQLAYHRQRYPSSSSQAGDAYETTPVEGPSPDRQSP